MLHPIRATGTLAFLLLLLTICLFIAFMFALVGRGGEPVVLAVTGGATIASFFLWVRENRIAQMAANAPAAPRHEIKASWLIPLQAGLVMAYVAALMASIHYVPGLDGFLKGLVQSLPIGLVAGWVVVWVYIIVESDEMIRSLMITATAISAGAVLCLVTFWALVTLHASLPAFDAIFLFPAFATIYGVAAAILTSRVE
ncbi:hypothetical protein X907_2289 [Glycocaulis alkaliphilus]|uniref:Uncharacterized protein n=1 Tax=Glycocaulis alkaliphilus TaxID=1434191 RepID=A0A3T0EBT4_9PROT|nr:hypothetical protein X907_2289 [Glycocaulis alkaliphilus]